MNILKGAIIPPGREYTYTEIAVQNLFTTVPRILYGVWTPDAVKNYASHQDLKAGEISTYPGKDNLYLSAGERIVIIFEGVKENDMLRVELAGWFELSKDMENANGYEYEKTETMTWTDVNNKTSAPDVDTELNGEQATEIMIQADTKDSRNASTDVDVIVIADPAGDGTYDDATTYLTAMNLGDAARKTIYLTPGINKFKLRLKENASLAAYVTASVTMRRKRS